MGNNFAKFFKKEEDEISDIRHYLEYLNQEKKRNFEPLAESRKTHTSVSTKPAFCDLSNCVNLLAFNKKTVIIVFFLNSPSPFFLDKLERQPSGRMSHSCPFFRMGQDHYQRAT